MKILPRVTTPTKGQVKLKGRVASLLEVGTGFHPEQTGRENIFLNGAILGMTKAEIKSKFDGIVDFYVYKRLRKYSHLYIEPCGWLIVHPIPLLKGAKILGCSIKNKRYLATLPRSGTGYITCLLTSACDMKAGGTGEYKFKFANGNWMHNIKIVWPSVLHNFVGTLKNGQPIHKDFIMMAHHPIQKTNMFKVKWMKVVFTVRNIMDQLESWLLHTFDDSSAQDEFIRQGYVERTINYFNYWGDFISRPDKTAEKDYVCIRYEDLTADPLANIKRMVKLWVLDIDDSILEKAVELCSREKMKSKIPADLLESNKKISIRANRGRVFSKQNIAYIDRAIRDNLRHDFGCTFRRDYSIQQD